MNLYVDDYFTDDMLYIALLRSPHPSAEIASFYLPKDIPDEYGILAAGDIPGENYISIYENTMPLLSEGTTRYTGEPIFIVYGPEERGVIGLRDRIDVDYHETTRERFFPHGKDQVVAERTIEKGDVETTLSKAFQTVEAEYTTAPFHANFSDPIGAFSWKDGETINVVCPTQWPYHVQETIVRMLAKPRKQVVVKVANMSSPHNGKIWYPSLIAACTALVSQISGRPVKHILSREEEFLYSNKQAPVAIRHRTGLNKNGDPVAMDVSIDLDCGAYPLLTREIVDRMSIGATGVYLCKNVRVKTRAIRTSTPPKDTVYGLGLSQIFFATETHFSRIAELLQIDPTDWKGKNILKKGNAYITGSALAEDSPEEALIEQVAKRSDFRRKHAAYELIKKRRESGLDSYFSSRGIGLSVAYQGNGFHGRLEEKQSYSVAVNLDKEGKVTIRTSAVSGKKYINQVWKQIASDILGIDTTLITVEDVDTSLVPNSGPSVASRNVMVISKLIERCCQTIAKRRFRDPLPIEVKRSFRLPKTFRWDERSFSGKPFPYLSWGAAVVEVEVDTLCLKPVLKGIWLALDCGKLYDERTAHKSVIADTLHVLDWISSKTFDYNKHSWTNYTFDQAGTFGPPHIRIDFLSTQKQPGYGGIGDLAANLIPAAFTSAVSQATGYYIDSLPVYPELIYQYMEES